MGNATLEATNAIISDAQKQQFQEQGYFILETVVPPRFLQDLRDESQRFIDEMDAEMDRLGVDTLGLNNRDSRYFLMHASRKSPKLRRFLFSPLMADICRATLGPDAVLFFDQYVIKAAEKGMKFSWHQDSGYVGYAHAPYLTCWIALDDVSEANGTVYLLPYDRQGTREMVPHVRDAETNDMVGYFGDDPGIPVVVPAGSIACFSSTVFHRSGFNTTDKMRRVYLAQYSAQPILTEDGSRALNEDVPFLKGGGVVAPGEPSEG